MGGLRVMVAALLVAVCVVQHAESRSVKKRNIDDDIAELLVRFMNVSTGILVYAYLLSSILKLSYVIWRFNVGSPFWFMDA